MTKKKKDRRSLTEILASTSDTLFPQDMGQHPVAIDSVDVVGDTPLHVLVARKDVYSVRVLIEAGANVDAIGDMGETPLHVAMRVQCLGAVEALLLAGAKIHIRSEFDETAQEKAKSIGGDIEKLFKRLK